MREVSSFENHHGLQWKVSWDDTKQNEEQSDPKKPAGEQITDLVAAAAGARAEPAVKSVAKRVRKAAAKKTPDPVKKAVRSISKASKASERTTKRGAKKS